MINNKSNMKYFVEDHRIGSDECNKINKIKQSQKINNYNLFNFYKTNHLECKEDVEQLNMFAANNYMQIKEGYGMTNSCFVDNDSSLRFTNQQLTNDKGKTQLFARTFAAVPDLSKGAFKATTESKLIQGSIVSGDKTCMRHSEQQYDNFIPLLSCIRDNVQNPNKLKVELNKNTANCKMDLFPKLTNKPKYQIFFQIVKYRLKPKRLK